MTGLDQAKLERLQERILADVAGAMGAFMAFIGDETGVYRVLAAKGPCTSDELADRANVDRRYLREWLSSNAALGYVEYDAADDTFSMSPEQAELLAQDATANSMQPFIQGLMGQLATQEKAVDVFRSGRGRPWGEHHSCCFCSTDRGFRVMYKENLVQNWIPSLSAVEAKLKSGGKVADIACGHGSSTLYLAQAFPDAAIHGFDFHPPSIDFARKQAAHAGVRNAVFHIATAKAFPGDGYDLVCVFDALHDMGDPVGASRHVRNALKPDGAFMVVEPIAEDELKDNLTKLAAIYFGFSTTVCLPASRSQEVALCLGAQAGERRLTAVLKEAGFSRVRRSMSTPSNMVLEARP